MAQKQSETTTYQVGQTRDEKGRITGGVPPVGFHTNPENRNPGGWKKEDSYSYQLKLMDRMTVKEFKEWISKNPENKRTMAQEKAYNAQFKSRTDLQYLKEVTDRTEGKAPQTVDVTTQGESINPLNSLTVEELRKLANQ